MLPYEHLWDMVHHISTITPLLASSSARLLDHHWPIRQSLVLEQLTQRNITHALSKQNLELIVMKLV